MAAARRGQAAAVRRMFGEEDDPRETARGRMEKSGGGCLDCGGWWRLETATDGGGRRIATVVAQRKTRPAASRRTYSCRSEEKKFCFCTSCTCEKDLTRFDTMLGISNLYSQEAKGQYIYMYMCREYAGNPSYKWGNTQYII
jgi:hypothetical protein